MPVENNYTVFRGVALVFHASPPTAEDITGWGLQCEIGPAGPPTYPAQTVLLTLGNVSPDTGIAITTALSGLFSITITSAQSKSLGVGKFPYNVWRTDTGDEDLIAYGTITVLPAVRW